MHKLTGKQCKMARALLKWNIYDLVTRLNAISPKRIDSYERGLVHIAEWENDEILKAFRKEGVQFNTDMDVVLKDGQKAKPAGGHGTGQGAHIVLDADNSVLSDTTATIPSLISREQDDAVSAEPVAKTQPQG